MKRSDLQKKLSFYIAGFDCRNIQTADYVANLVLELVEEAGMSPPMRDRPHDWHERGITYSQWIQEPSKIREWDKEDE